jgi:hypothetical protein
MSNTLLIKRLKVLGLPDDVNELINEWLMERFYYVQIHGCTSTLFNLLLGTVQGYILGTNLYALFATTCHNKEVFLSLPDDLYLHKGNKSLPQLINHMEKSPGAMTKWLRDSGLKVNEAKTEVCLFTNHHLQYKNPSEAVFGNIFDAHNVLGSSSV